MGQRSAKDDVLKDANPLLRQGPPWACSLPTRPEWPVMGCWGSLLCLLSAESSVHHPARHCGFWGWNLGVLFFWWTMCFTTGRISSAPTMHNLLSQYWTQKQIRILKAFSGPAVWQSWAQSWREFTYSYELCHLAWTATFLCRKVQCITEASLLQIYLGAWWWTM